MFTRSELSNLLNAQDELNKAYTGEDWRKNVNPYHLETAILTELAEWMESSPRVGAEGTDGWKWWRLNLENDVQNQKVEAIDVLHFVLSSMMLHNTKETIMSKLGIAVDYIDNRFAIQKPNIGTVLNSYNAWYNTHDTERGIVNGLILIMVVAKATSDDTSFMYDGYFKKNELNLQRIKSGYMSGDYQKHDENGNEDNRGLVL